MHLAHNCQHVDVIFDNESRDYNVCSKGFLTVTTENRFSAIIAASNLAERRQIKRQTLSQFLAEIANETRDEDNA